MNANCSKSGKTRGKKTQWKKWRRHKRKQRKTITNKTEMTHFKPKLSRFAFCSFPSILLFSQFAIRFFFPLFGYFGVSHSSQTSRFRFRELRRELANSFRQSVDFSLKEPLSDQRGGASRPSSKAVTASSAVVSLSLEERANGVRRAAVKPEKSSCSAADPKLFRSLQQLDRRNIRRETRRMRKKRKFKTKNKKEEEKLPNKGKKKNKKKRKEGITK